MGLTHTKPEQQQQDVSLEEERDMVIVENGIDHASILCQEPHPLVWRDDALRAVKASGLALGPWWEAVAAVKGWQWVRLAAEPFTDWSLSAIGFQAQEDRPNLFICGEFNSNDKLDGFGLMVEANEWYYGQLHEGKPHGKGVRVYQDGSRYEGDWVDGQMHGRGIKVYARGSFYDGEWSASKWHGQGAFVYHNGRHCRVGSWENGEERGAFRESTCACFDYNPQFIKQRDHHINAPTACKPFGFVMEVHYKKGSLHGLRKMTWCNGDTCEELWDEDKLISKRFVLSPECPVESFRGRVIEGIKWRSPVVTRADKSLSYTLNHPDPLEAPEMFHMFREYYEQSFLPVEDRDREDISALLARAAAEIKE